MLLKLAQGAKAADTKTVRPAAPQPFQDEPSPQAGAGQPTTSVGANRKILVVDDNPVVLKAFEMKLKAEGFAVCTTANAAEVASTATQTNAELIILDVNFPATGSMEWTGFTVIQWLRRFSELGGVPVILISGSNVAEHEERIRASGAVAFFQKPINYQELRNAILEALGEAPPAQPV